MEERDEKQVKSVDINIPEIMEALRATSSKHKPFVNSEQGIVHIGNNELCYCGSGKKFKKCCKNKEQEKELYNIITKQV